MCSSCVSEATGLRLRLGLVPRAFFSSLTKLQPLIRLSRSLAVLDLAGLSRFVEDFALFRPTERYLRPMPRSLSSWRMASSDSSALK